MEIKFSDRMSKMSGAATREILKLLTRPEIVSFAGGFPATDCLPSKEVAEIASEILSNPLTSTAALQYGSTEGFNELREELIKYVASTGISAEMSGVQVLSGGQQGIDLMSKVFLNKDDVILVESPTYLTALQIFNSYQAKIVGVMSDANGLDLNDLEDKIKKYSPKMLYIVPTFSNPTGNTYTEENRKAIAELTYRHNVIVLEDDPYSKLRFEGSPVPALKHFDKGGNIVYVTSFSKVLAPGLRAGAAIGNPEIIRKLSIGKQGVDVSTSNLSQLIVKEYLKRGYLMPIIQKNLPKYKAKKDCMMKAIEEYMPESYEHTNPEGGLFIWGRVRGLNMVELFPKAVERNVAYIHGSVFYNDATGREDTFRLNFSNATEEKIIFGIKALGGLLKEELAKIK
jgi:2-aminoadipate transaminase